MKTFFAWSLLIVLVISTKVFSKKFKENEKPEWAKKDIRDYTDADMERLLDQWEVNNVNSKKNTEN